MKQTTTKTTILKGFSGYQIYEDGRVYSLKSNKFLTQFPNAKGYLRVTMVNDDGVSKNMRVNRLVAMAFIENPEGLSDVDHIDGNKQNNHVSNLQWMASADNVRKATCKRVYCIETNEIFNSATEAAKKYGVAISGVSSACTHPTRTAAGFHFCYIDKLNQNLIERHLKCLDRNNLDLYADITDLLINRKRV